ncbi:MAG TPA: DUF4249 domain-containing protein [Bacteroidales bacterium]|nr:DUF4249 domain-containing protein [Bacteroidales bacterium]
MESSDNNIKKINSKISLRTILTKMNGQLKLISINDPGQNNASLIRSVKTVSVRIAAFLFLLLATGFFTSCNELEEEIQWDIETAPEMLVVESVITNELKNQSVKLTLSRPYFDRAKPAAVSGAIMKLTEGTNVYSLIESSENPGVYISEVEFRGEPLKTYALKINLPEKVNGLLEYSAISTMPEGIDLDSAGFYIFKMPEFNLGEAEDGEEVDSTILGVYFFGNEPESDDNFYINKVFRNDIPLQKSSKEYLIYPDDNRNGEYSYMNAFICNIAEGDKITFQVLSIEKGFYKFLEGVINSEQSGGMGSISGPPANAVGNIQDGKGLGYFTAAYISEITGFAMDKR